MTNPSDDLEAVRIISEALKAFDDKEKDRIIRWARERLGLQQDQAIQTSVLPAQQSSNTPIQVHSSDIKTFVDSKNPRNDVQFAATIAYYYRFEAPENERKEAITSADLQEACRKAKRERFEKPSMTLNNAHKLGLLDKTGERGNFTINSVGENLVAMTLPQQTSTPKIARRQKPKAKPATKVKAKKTKTP